ncbi:MAG: c-type cytochrome [Alphaproteobacteria bacterium]|nr:MAG: c-type cytochrome [Alphaproteobacteria bacterium]
MSKCLNSVLTLRSVRSTRLERWHQLRVRPSFETRPLAAPQDEVWSVWLRSLLAALALFGLVTTALAADRKLGIGRTASPHEIAGWDIDVRPDGQGLPPGRGSVKEGEALYVGKCAACHGEFGESAGRWPQVAGGAGSLKSSDPVKTVGSYFAHLSTVIDYVRRAMPFGDAQSLTEDELYAVVAYTLFLNDIVDENFVLSRETFDRVKMPNAGGFHDDDRETAEKAFWNPQPCMTDCKPEVRITGRARVIDVTPDDKAIRRSVD